MKGRGGEDRRCAVGIFNYFRLWFYGTWHRSPHTGSGMSSFPMSTVRGCSSSVNISRRSSVSLKTSPAARVRCSRQRAVATRTNLAPIIVTTTDDSITPAIRPTGNSINSTDAYHTDLSYHVTYQVRPHLFRKTLSTLSQKSATVAENGETTATVAEFCDSRTFLRQCGQGLK